MKSVIIGAGTYGEVYLSYLREAGIDVLGFLDDNSALKGSSIMGLPILGDTSLLESLKRSHGVEAVYCPIGNNCLRVRLLERARLLGYQIPNYIHPTVVISPDVKIGMGVYILLGTVIMPHVELEDYVMISQGVRLAHHSVLEKGTFLSSGCNFGASIRARKFTYCGMSSTIMTGLKNLGEDCLIGAGAVVVKDVPEKAVVAGVPAKVIRYKE